MRQIITHSSGGNVPPNPPNGGSIVIAPQKSSSNFRNSNRRRDPLAQLNSELSLIYEESEDPTKFGMSLDDLEMIRTIGAGTFGRVILVQEKNCNFYGALKILHIPELVRRKQVDHVRSEKELLKEISHPFIVNLRWSSKDQSNIYFLMDFVPGGELFTYLRSAGKFSSNTSVFYAAETLFALEYLHSRHIAFRDLKPENLLLDKDGHLKLTDFGFAKIIEDRTWTLCGTPEYLAPEVIQSKGHNKAVDFWALGVLIYEMLHGHPPFYGDNPFCTYEKILEGKPDFSRFLEPASKDICKKLLVVDRSKRLGNLKGGIDDVKRHRWFRDVNWNDVIRRKLKPPIIPKVSFEGDSSNFDEYPEQEGFFKTSRKKFATEEELQLFKDF